MFYEKALSVWRDGTGYSRTQLVKSYFQNVSGFTEPEVITEVLPDGVEDEKRVRKNDENFYETSEFGSVLCGRQL